MAKHLKRKGEKGGMTATGKDQLAISKAFAFNVCQYKLSIGN